MKRFICNSDLQQVLGNYFAGSKKNEPHKNIMNNIAESQVKYYSKLVHQMENHKNKDNTTNKHTITHDDHKRKVGVSN